MSVRCHLKTNDGWFKVVSMENAGERVVMPFHIGRPSVGFVDSASASAYLSEPSIVSKTFGVVGRRETTDYKTGRRETEVWYEEL